MSKSTGGSRLAEKYGVTPGKLVLIGILFVVFVSVVYWNFLRGTSGAEPVAAEEKGPPAVANLQPARPEAGAAAESADAPPAAEKPRKPWPRFELAEVIARDPFALPEQFPQPAPRQAAVVVEQAASGSQPGTPSDEERAAELATIQKQGVQLILLDGHEYVAKIGDRQVRVGDRIGGYRVVEINIRGVELEGDASP